MNENKKPTKNITNAISLIIIAALLISNIMQFAMYIQSQEKDKTILEDWKTARYKDGFLDALQFETGFIEQSGVLVKGVGLNPINSLVFGSVDDILQNKKSAYAAGSSSGSIYKIEYNPAPEWYSKKEYDNKYEIIYIHDSAMDNDTKWKYYWAGHAVLLGRMHELDNKPIQSFVETTSNLQKSFYFLGRCQMKSVLNMEFDKYNYYQNKTYDLMNASWDYMNNFNYNSGCD